MFDVCVIGHITKDLICIDGKLCREMPGGTAYYTSLALRHLGLRVAVVTKVAQADREYLLRELQSCGIAVFCKDSTETTVFVNSYRSEHFADRVQAVYATANPFSPDDAALFHLGPLTNRDLSVDVLQAVARKGKVVSLDVQRFVRKVAHGEVRTADWREKAAGLPYVHILKAGEEEATVLSGETEAKRAALRLAAYGPAEVIITLGRKGSVILSHGQFFSIPALPAKTVVDPTGCGDTYMAGYLYQRLRSADPSTAGRFAAAIATAKLAHFGPLRSDEAVPPENAAHAGSRGCARPASLRTSTFSLPNTTKKIGSPPRICRTGRKTARSSLVGGGVRERLQSARLSSARRRCRGRVFRTSSFPNQPRRA